MTQPGFDVAIVGAGIVGLATGMELLKRRPGTKLVVLDKEDRVAAQMEALRTIASTLSMFDRACVHEEVGGGSLCRAVSLTAKLPTIVASFDRLRRNRPPIEPRHDLGHAANLLWMLSGTEPQDLSVEALETYFVLLAEHGMNAWTFSARVTASTLGDVYSAIVTALGTLKGPLHGGAAQKAMEDLLDIGSLENVDAWFESKMAAGQRMFGFGHRVYKAKEPRATILRDLAHKAATGAGKPKWYDIAARLEERVLASPYFKERKLFTNVDFYTAPLLDALGIPLDLFIPMFAISRIAGWTAHVLEQQQNNRLIRPRAYYAGPRDRTWTVYIAFIWDVQEAGAGVMDRCGTPLPEAVLGSIRSNKVALKGPITTPIGTGFRSVNVGVRLALDLYANLRPARAMQGIPVCHPDVDLVVVRENTECLYAGIEHDVIPNVAAESIRIITRRASERIARFAFEYARSNGRRLVTAVHKANILKATDGLFLRVAQEVAAQYPDIAFNDRIVDNMAMQLVQRPEEYDILLCPNLFGDILSDLCSGLVGGLGVAPGANIGSDMAVFEPVHGSAPKYAGQNKVNPTATILSGALMLRHLGESEAAHRVEAAVQQVIADGKSVTYDLKPSRDDPTAVGTQEMAGAMIASMA